MIGSLISSWVWEPLLESVAWKLRGMDFQVPHRRLSLLTMLSNMGSLSRHSSRLEDDSDQLGRSSNNQGRKYFCGNPS